LSILVVVNKTDKPEVSGKHDALNKVYPELLIVPISLKNTEDIDVLARTIYDLLGIMRVYKAGWTGTIPKTHNR
jgi:ribosome-interacting GTPase 1